MSAHILEPGQFGSVFCLPELHRFNLHENITILDSQHNIWTNLDEI